MEADAGVSDAYEGAVPADLVLVCGVFGNVAEPDIEATIGFLPRLCAPGGAVVWTRYPEPVGILDRIEAWLRGAGFEPYALVVPDPPEFGVGAARLVGLPLPFEPGRRLFTFVQ